MNKLMLLVLLLLVTADALGQNQEDHNDFELYTECSKLGLLVYDLISGAPADMKERIETVVRSRLRGARIYESNVREAGAAVVVEFGIMYPETNGGVVVGVSFNVNFFLAKPVTDFYGNRGSAMTWLHTMNMGLHGKNDDGFMLQHIGELADNFIDKYLEVNESACE